MEASIIIVTRNRAGQLAKALQSMRRLAVPDGLETEILVVDNGSTDDTARVARSTSFRGKPIRYVIEPRNGQSQGRNRGLAETRGEVILFTDDDVRVPPNWLTGMCELLVAGKASAVAGGVRLSPELLRPWMSVLHRSWLASSEWLDPDEPSSFIGANMAFVRSVLRDVPLFDPELGPGAIGFGDETLFALQLQKAGHHICSRMQVQVEHHFNPERLKREAWLDLADRAGRTKAYVTYHWRHRAYRLPQPRLVLTRMLLTSWRMRHPGYKQAEGCTESELRLISIQGELRGFLQERNRRPNYEPNGLLKLEHSPERRPQLVPA